MSVSNAKSEIDTLINNARFRCHRPIRIAEILYHSRTDSDIDISNVESYRVDSANWRDEISIRLTGKGSSSSRSYQKDFSNLIEPSVLEVLDDVNQEGGIVENYIYRRLKNDKWSGLIAAQEYVTETDVDEFSFEEYMGLTDESGLEEDSILEISVYALFQAITEELGAKAKLELESPDETILSDFKKFVETFLGLGEGEVTIQTNVDIHRAGQGTYAADKGVDIGTNFGTMVQVKHVTLDTDQARSIENNAYVDRIVIVCRDAERELITSVSSQLGFDKIAGVVTLSELEEWFNMCFGKYQTRLGSKVLQYLRNEFKKEFQTGDYRIPDIDEFFEERGYEADDLSGMWELNDYRQEDLT
ncbi:MAG: HaeII family restriction endonuclease [Candidatus Paceibacteria bacterium]